MTKSVQGIGWELRSCAGLASAVMSHLPFLDLSTCDFSPLVTPKPVASLISGVTTDTTQPLLSTFILLKVRNPRAMLHNTLHFPFWNFGVSLYFCVYF